MEGVSIRGDVVVYDDDHYAIGSAIAERLAASGAKVTLVTPAPLVSYWTLMILEQASIERRLVDAGVTLVTRGVAEAAQNGGFVFTDDVTRARREIACGTLVLVTSRISTNGLAIDLRRRSAEWADAGIESVTAIGDALAPAMIVHAVHAGHRFARELDTTRDPAVVPYRYEPVV
jgi:dimethylamine/trimethylamine dehydrogenase